MSKDTDAGPTNLPCSEARQPPWLLRPLFQQFARPAGPFGRLAGKAMARSIVDDRWIVGLLDVQSHDRVLDVGCGPGLTLSLIAARATAGFVAGVDPSDVMRQQASRRNGAAITAGRVEVRPGTAADLPYADGYFSKACAVHSLYFWPSVGDGLRELYRVLVPRGLLVLAVRMYRAGAGPLDPNRYGYTTEQLTHVVATLGSIGFGNLATQCEEIGRETITAILARR